MAAGDDQLFRVFKRMQIPTGGRTGSIPRTLTFQQWQPSRQDIYVVPSLHFPRHTLLSEAALLGLLTL